MHLSDSWTLTTLKSDMICDKEAITTAMKTPEVKKLPFFFSSSLKSGRPHRIRKVTSSKTIKTNMIRRIYALHGLGVNIFQRGLEARNLPFDPFPCGLAASSGPRCLARKCQVRNNLIAHLPIALSTPATILDMIPAHTRSLPW